MTGEGYATGSMKTDGARVRIVARCFDGTVVSLREAIASILAGSSRPAEWTVVTQAEA